MTIAICQSPKENSRCAILRARFHAVMRLVYDAFEAHVTDRVKALLNWEKTDLAVIPGGLTSILQPLDVSLNKPFKDGVRRRWMQWMAEGIHEFTATGRQKKASEYGKRNGAKFNIEFCNNIQGDKVFKINKCDLIQPKKFNQFQQKEIDRIQQFAIIVKQQIRSHSRRARKSVNNSHDPLRRLQRWVGLRLNCFTRWRTGFFKKLAVVF